MSERKSAEKKQVFTHNQPNLHTNDQISQTNDENNDPEWYVNDDNRHLFYNIDECDKTEIAIQQLQSAVDTLRNEINDLRIMASCNPLIGCIIESPVAEEYIDPFFKELLYDIQITNSELITDNIKLKEKIRKYENVVSYYFGFALELMSI
eukprot:555644_1